MMAGLTPCRERAATAAALALAVLATFGSTLGDSVFLQPPASLLSNPLLGRLAHIPSILSADFLTYSEGQYRPLSYVLLALLRSMVPADSSGVWHALLVLTHWLNALLVSRIVHHFARAFWPSLFAGLLLAVHPLASGVTNDAHLFHFILGLTLYLSAFYLYLLSEEGHNGRARYAGSVGLYIAGLFVTKATFTLPVLLIAYEGLYRRSEWRRIALRLAIFVGLTAAVSPLWWMLKPHPLHFRYIVFPPGTTWLSLATVIGASDIFLRGLLTGWGIPGVLHDMVTQIYSPANVRLAVMVTVDLALLLFGALLMHRRHWGGLGLVAIPVVLLPYASTGWNNIHEYVQWNYLYASIAGTAISLSWLLSTCRLARTPSVLLGAALWLLLPYFGWQQAHLNRLSTSPVAYWGHVLRLVPESETANIEFGKACLAEGDVAKARDHLFAPPVKTLSVSATVMCQHYVRQGDFIAAAVHLRMAFSQGRGLQFGHGEPLMAEVMQAVEALDHAEAALGKVLTCDPHDLAAMERLVTIWLIKGHRRAAEKIARRAVHLDPGAPQTQRLLAALQEADQQAAPSLTPPSPSWLRYAAQGARDPHSRQEIVACASRHPEDPVVGLAAVVSLIEDGEYGQALERVQTVTAAMPSWSFAWAMHCWVSTENGAFDQAIAAGRRALELDNQDATVHNTVGILHARLAERESEKKHHRERAIVHFREALRLNSKQVSARVNLGRELARQGRSEDALALYRGALRLRPDLAEAHFQLGSFYAERDQVGEAIKCYQDAVHARGDYVEAHYNLGLVLAKDDDLEAAGKCFREALRLRPEFSRARDALAALSTQVGDFGEAMAVLREGLQTNPGHVRGVLMLAMLLGTCPDSRYRDGQAAVALAEAACRVTKHSSSDALFVLAELRAASGDLDGAVRAASQSLQVADAVQRPDHVARVRQRLEHFQRQTALGH